MLIFSAGGKMKSSTRKPLQPKNIFLPSQIKPKGLQWTPEKPPLFPHSNKENHPTVAAILAPPPPIHSIDASLAEELSVFRKKLERLRADRERTEEMLKERDRAMDLWMRELLHRGEIQKMLEIEVDRLFRLKEFHANSTKISPIRSLREKQREKRNGSGVPMSPVPMGDDTEGSEEENTVQSPSSIPSQEIAPK